MTRYNMKRSGFRMLNMPSECPDMRDRVPAVLCRATAYVNSMFSFLPKSMQSAHRRYSDALVTACPIQQIWRSPAC